MNYRKRRSDETELANKAFKGLGSWSAEARARSLPELRAVPFAIVTAGENMYLPPTW